jgi:hypothetical protein
MRWLITIRYLLSHKRQWLVCIAGVTIKDRSLRLIARRYRLRTSSRSIPFGSRDCRQPNPVQLFQRRQQRLCPYPIPVRVGVKSIGEIFCRDLSAHVY